MTSRIPLLNIVILTLLILSTSCGSNSNTNDNEDGLTGQLLIGNESKPIASGALTLYREDTYYGTQLTLTDGNFQKTEYTPEERESFTVVSWSDASIALRATLSTVGPFDTSDTFLLYDELTYDYRFDATIERYENGGRLHLDDESLRFISGTIHIDGEMPNLSITVDGQLENGLNVSATAAGVLIVDEWMED